MKRCRRRTRWNSARYMVILCGTLSAIGTIAHVAGDDPNEIVRDIVAQTYEQVVNG